MTQPGWTVWETQYQGGQKSGTWKTRLPDKMVATGLTQGAADAMINKAKGRRWSTPTKGV